LLPVLAHWFGLHPWDVERLTIKQTDIYLSWVRQQQTRNK
jgi:hypothetical protein